MTNSPVILYRDSRIGHPASYPDGKKCAMLRSFWPHKPTSPIHGHCLPASIRSSTFTYFIAGPLGKMRARLQKGIPINFLSKVVKCIYMIFLSRITVSILLLLSYSCTYEYNNNNKIQLLDVESNIDKMEVVNLSQFSNDIKYVPLETAPNIFFQGLWECIFSDGLILARDLNKCILFDHNGKFKARIGKNGRGPGEYYNLKCADFGADSNIFIQGNMSLYEYDLNGSFIKQYENIFRLDNDTYNALARWIFFGDSLFLGHVANSNGLSEDKALIINKYGDIETHFKNHIFQNRERPTIGFFEDFAHIIKFDEKVFYKEFFNDTIFLLDDNLKFLPLYVFRFGKYKLPSSFRLNINPEDYINYIKLWEVFQTKDFLLLRFDFGKWFPAKRLTPKPNPYVIGGNPKWTNTIEVLGIFNKNTKELIFCKPTNTDNPLFTSGLYNDIDCGPRFFPSEQVNDSTMVMKIDAKKLKEHIASDDFKNINPKYPEKKKQLEELAGRLTEYDNPVLMLVTFNK